MIFRKTYMDPMSVVLRKIAQKDQGNEVTVLPGGLLKLKGNVYHQDEIVIIRTYRFEGESDPGDAAILYVIQTRDGSMGYCLDGYGMYTSHTNDLHSDFIHHALIATSHRQELN